MIPTARRYGRNRFGKVASSTVKLPARLKFHALRHTYASLCVAAGIPPLEIARFMGHANLATNLSV